jgi:hypothetical protein
MVMQRTQVWPWFEELCGEGEANSSEVGDANEPEGRPS